MANIQYQSKEVVQRQILCALEDDNEKCAILCDKEDLRVLILALRIVKNAGNSTISVKAKAMLEDFTKLNEAMFE